MSWKANASVCSPCSIAGVFCCWMEGAQTATAANASKKELRPPVIVLCSQMEREGSSRAVFLCSCQLHLTTSHKSSCGSTLQLQTALLLFPAKPELSPATHFLRSEAPQFPRLIFLHEGAWLMLSSSCFSPHDVFLAPRTKLNNHQSLMLFLLFHKTLQ